MSQRVISSGAVGKARGASPLSLRAGEVPHSPPARGQAMRDDREGSGDDSGFSSQNNLSSRTRTQSADAGPLPLGFLGAGKTIKAITPATALPLFSGMALARSRIHEVTGRAADGFVLSVLGSAQNAKEGNIIWTGRQGGIAALCPLAMNQFFDPARLITCGCITRKEILWSAEQALRSRGAAVVVAEMRQGPNLRESRRLQLAAEAGRTLGLILIERGAQSSASQTRWHCEPANGNAWSWQLLKNKAGRLGTWQVEWRQVEWKERGHEKGYVHMVSESTA